MPESVRWVRVAAAVDVPPGTVQGVEADGRRLALINREGEFFALDATCPHRGGPLDQGVLWHGALECPWHHFRFDPATGRNLYPANVFPDDLSGREDLLRSARSFPMEVRDGELYVALRTDP